MDVNRHYPRTASQISKNWNTRFFLILGVGIGVLVKQWISGVSVVSLSAGGRSASG